MRLFLLWGCLVLPGYGELVGPKEISGFEGDTVSLRCTYGDEQKKFQKYWCRESGLLISRCSGTIYAEMDGREKTVGKVSIQDSRPERAIKVTLRGISQQDAGQYWCGIHKLGFDETALVSLLVFPGRRAGGGDREKRVRQRGKGTRPDKGRSQVGEQPEACDTGKKGQPCRGPHPKGAEGQAESLEVSADPHPTVSIVKTGFHAPPLAGGSPHGHEGASPFPGASPPAGTSPHTHAATSPPAGTYHPTARLDPPSSEDPSLVSSSSSSKPRMVVPTARMLAPMLVLLALLLATGLAALSRCVILRRKEAKLEDSPKDKDEKMPLSHLTLDNSRGPECTVIDLVGPTEPDSSPLPSTEGQPQNQTSEEEQGSPLELQGNPVPGCPLQVPAEESGFVPV